MAGAYNMYGEEERCIQVLVGKSEIISPLGRPRRRWENNNKMDVQEMGWRLGLDRCGSAQG